MNISFKSEYEQCIQAQVETGNYNSVHEVMNKAFRLLAKRTQRLTELRQNVSMGTQQIAPDQVTDGETVLAQLQAKTNSYE